MFRKPINYFGYIRKSTDVEDKQVSSLEDQEKIIGQIAKRYGITLIFIYSESKSAKQPGREKFNEMIRRINNGEAVGIIAWKIDRLTRNPVDSGTIQYMLQNGKLERIITNDREYNPVDAGLLFSVETGMSNQFILDLRKNVKRGMDSKTDKGVFCGKAPTGYINNKLDKTIDIDEKRFSIVRKMWEYMLTGNYSVPEITDIAANKWGFKRKPSGRSIEKPISLGLMYRIFTNIFYTGCFNWNGGIKQGTHKAMVTHNEFNRVQELLGRSGKTTALQKHDFAFTGFMKCGECGASITASEVKRRDNIYSYYHCVRKGSLDRCKQKYCSLENLEEEVLKILDSINIVPECLEWCIDILRRNTQKERDDKALILKNLQGTLNKQKSDLERVLGLCIRGIINEDQYIQNKLKIEEDIEMTEKKIYDFENNGDYGSDITEKVFDFVSKAKESFINGNLKTKKIILKRLSKKY